MSISIDRQCVITEQENDTTRCFTRVLVLQFGKRLTIQKRRKKGQNLVSVGGSPSHSSFNIKKCGSM